MYDEDGLVVLLSELSLFPEQTWLKMSVDSENSFLLPTPQDLRTSCVFQTTEEPDEAPGGAEER